MIKKAPQQFDEDLYEQTVNDCERQYEGLKSRAVQDLQQLRSSAMEVWNLAKDDIRKLFVILVSLFKNIEYDTNQQVQVSQSLTNRSSIKMNLTQNPSRKSINLCQSKNSRSEPSPTSLPR